MTYPDLLPFMTNLSILLSGLLIFGAAWYAFNKFKDAL